MDFEEAQEAAQRLRRMVPPQALGIGPTEKEQQLTQVVTSLQASLAKSLDAHGKDRVKLVGKDQMRDIDAYEAETGRFAALAKMLPMDEEGVRKVIEALVTESLGTKLLPILQANIHGIEAGGSEEVPPGDEAPPMPGARLIWR